MAKNSVVNSIGIRLIDNFYLLLYPVLGYLAAFFYKLSYLSYFGVTAQFVYVDFIDIIQALFYMTLVGIFVLVIMLILRSLFSIDIFLIVLFIISSFIAYYSYIRDGWTIANIVIYSIPLFLLLTFISEKIGLKILKLPSVQKKGVADEFLERFSQKKLNFLRFLGGLTLTTLLLSVFAGTILSANKKEYYVYQENNKNYAIVGTYYDRLIGVEVDIPNNKLKREYILIYTEENLPLKKLDLGTLNNQEVRNIN